VIDEVGSLATRSVVAIGGGHGLAVVLRALAGQVGSLTAVVSVADDGGSSGRLRRDFDILAPGDLRRCLSALAEDPMVAAAFEQRFEQGGLTGHPAGNVILASLLRLAEDPVDALDTAATMVNAQGRVLPAAQEPVDLVATTTRGTIRGQVAIRESGGIQDLRFSPAAPRCSPQVCDVIRSADTLILGPGSLYTSVLAAVVPEVAAAINDRRGPLVYVANLSSERGETDGYGAAEHLAAVRRHGIEPDLVLVDASSNEALPVDGRIARFGLVGATDGEHDPQKLRAALSELFS
jgi:uncharacterized cofD-like protein